MKKTISCRAAISLTLITLALPTAAAVSQTLADEIGPPTEAKPFIEYITTTSPYQQWQLWPGKGKMYPGTQPHGAFLTTYVNQTAYEAITQKAGTLPNGSIIVKENYSQEKELAAVTAMFRKAGYAPESGDWYWIKYAPDGTVEAEGKVAGCIRCHDQAKGNDWLFTGSISKE